MNRKLNKIRAKLNQREYKDCDGLIIIYSGHGDNDTFFDQLICSDGQKLSIFNLQRKFCPENCDFLANKPKIFYIDCCRGDIDITQDRVSVVEEPKGSSQDSN